MSYGTGDYTYELVDGWAKCPDEWIQEAAALFIDSQDRVYVLGRGAHPLTVFDRGGNILSSWEGGGELIGFAHGIYVDQDFSVYCADVRRHIVSKFSPEGELLLEIGNKDQPSDTGFVPPPPRHTGFLKRWAEWRDCLLATKKRAAPPFNRPTGVFVTHSGEIYVSDGYGNARIHKFSPEGTLLLSWGEVGDGPGQFINPHSVWVDKQERVWVCDRENYRIQIFSNQGEFLSEWEDLAYPCNVWIDDNEIVYVTENMYQQVSLFTIDGKRLARLCCQEDPEAAAFICPHMVGVDSHGDIYIADTAWSMWGQDRGCRSIVKLARSR